MAGLPVAAAVIDAVCGDAAPIDQLVADGTRVGRGDALMTVDAPTRQLLTAERSALNLLCHLSGVASLTAQWADALSGTGARVRDTRKTMPGLRALQKYAVRCGGGVNHRMSLSDAALVKDNHVASIGGVAEAFAAVRSLAATIPVEIEVDDLDELREAFAAGADLVMLDNFDVERMRAAVALRAELAPHVLLEASGGLTVADAARGGRDRRGLHRRRRADPLGAGPRHRPRSAQPGLNRQRVADEANSSVARRPNATSGRTHQIGPSGKSPAYLAGTPRGSRRVRRPDRRGPR